MDEVKQREIASKGGKAAHEKDPANEFDSKSARQAGRKGGQARGGRGEGTEDEEQATSGARTRGGSPEQHSQAGKQSHRNDR